MALKELPNNEIPNILYVLTIECSDECTRAEIARKMNNIPTMYYKKFLWDNTDSLFYIGSGNINTSKQLVDYISNVSESISAANAGTSVTFFLEENTYLFCNPCIGPQSPTRWHCWTNGRHVSIREDDGLLYESNLDLKNLIIDMCINPQEYNEHH